MSVRKLPDNKVTKDGRAYAFYINEYGLDGGALCFRFGNPAKSGASLKRLHAHLIMPKVDTKTKFTIGGHKTLKKGLKLNDLDNKKDID